jgi:arylsulfatase A-like enzyme
VAGCAAPTVGGQPIAVPRTSAQRADQPDIVMIVADDHRWDHVSAVPGHPAFLRTPNLDALAARGQRATNAFVTTALCSPSRATFLSGEFATQHGVQNNLTAWNPDTTTFFEPLMAAGYDCAFLGKWHMPGALPNLRGVDTFVTFTADEGQGVYVDCPLLVDGSMTERPGTYLTDELTTIALEWIDQRPKDRPYALWVAHKAVHHPFTPPDRYAGALADADIDSLPPESFEFLSLMDTNIWEGTLGRLTDVYRRYCETLLGLDDQVGRLVAGTEQRGRDTYVVYTSDNGYSWGEHALTGKRWAYEENTRVPLIVAGPGIDAGTTDALILNTDLAPTVLDWAGADPLPKAQGRSLRRVLEGAADSVRDEFLYEYFLDYPYHVPAMTAVRTHESLYIEYDAGRDPQLFDIVTDPRTQDDLAATEPERARQLARDLAALRATVAAGGVV